MLVWSYFNVDFYYGSGRGYVDLLQGGLCFNREYLFREEVGKKG